MSAGADRARGAWLGRAKRLLSRRLGERGVAAIEYAIILPAFLLLVLGIVDMGRLFWTQVTLDRAVQAAARCAAVNPTLCGSAGAVQSYAVSQAWGMGLTDGVFTSTTAACGANVTASLPFHLFAISASPADPTLQAAACYPVNP